MCYKKVPMQTAQTVVRILPSSWRKGANSETTSKDSKQLWVDFSNDDTQHFPPTDLWVKIGNTQLTVRDEEVLILISGWMTSISMRLSSFWSSKPHALVDCRIQCCWICTLRFKGGILCKFSTYEAATGLISTVEFRLAHVKVYDSMHMCISS